MQIYNSATHKKEEFVPNHPDVVKMYTCGPTVYHYAHIGNLRSYIMEDVLEKYLRYAGYHVKRVMNITDVGHLTSDADTGEDKMLKGAKREHKTVLEIAQFYTDAFFGDCAKLNIKTPDVVEPATHCVDEYIEIITRLLEKGYAYQAGGNVYFDTAKLDKYYVFNDHDADDLAVGVREGVEEDTNKRNKNDFVLWFTQSKFEDQALKWDSPWGVGYPGWHIECSGISMKHLGEDLDIHCGGIDNAFPHHTNEIAQSEAFLGHKWCNYWFHVLHLNTSSGKMSKSKGEFLTVSLLEEKGYDPLIYRLFCLQSHYRKALVFSWENLDNAKTAYDKLIARIAALKPGEGTADEAAASALRSKFKTALDNDLNTSLAVTALYDVLKAKTTDATKLLLLEEFDTVLGLGLMDRAEKKRQENAKTSKAASGSGYTVQGEGDPAVDAQVLARYEAKKNKNFAEADRIRDELKQQGIEITDVPGGAVWKRI
ncbi:cysteinyl-tRNA synthetase [Oscillibacter sp. PC13]|uniref:cysteine--tRNA ligase n=1 Tax=Oscillibacter sp. PC13 TaxID=1855299 RepID=UPI0008E0C921|nr:cysteine--tRNA ligase [Oscillibacter sp. PC13]SFP20308.1 cysteinyl-tRNA synthetase [Oscillibacter sp. PC13]